MTDSTLRGNILGATRQDTINPDVRCRAARYVASQAAADRDCAELLAMLGLHPQDGKR